MASDKLVGRASAAVESAATHNASAAHNSISLSPARTLPAAQSRLRVRQPKSLVFWVTNGLSRVEIELEPPLPCLGVQPGRRSAGRMGHASKLAILLAAGAACESVELTEKNFERLVVKSGKSALVKFQAPW